MRLIAAIFTFMAFFSVDCLDCEAIGADSEWLNIEMSSTVNLTHDCEDERSATCPDGCSDCHCGHSHNSFLNKRINKQYVTQNSGPDKTRLLDILYNQNELEPTKKPPKS